MAPITKLVDQIVSTDIARIMKSQAFRKHGRTFIRAVPDCEQIVNVQSSVWNRGEEGRFTLNLGVYFPGVAIRLAQQASGKVPREYDATVRLRIGHLLPENRDFWWQVCSHTDVEALSAEVASHLRQVAIPWLESVSSLDGALREVTTGRSLDPVTAAAIALELGRDAEALTILELAVVSQPALGRAARLLARRNGLPVETLKQPSADHEPSN